ncbi:MAG: magnesium transporter [Halomonadaceae bacterium]|nr:MAG: magnesium transporter [Halomonadaceae bacterium]
MLLVTSNMQSHAEALEEALKVSDLDAALQELRLVSPLRTARILSDVPKEVVKPFLMAVPQQQAADIVANFPPALSFSVLEELSEEQATGLMERLPATYLATMFRQISRDGALGWLALLSPELREQVEVLGSYENDSAGAVMSPYFLAVEQGLRVKDVIDAVRSAPKEIERTAYVFVVSPGGTLNGVISLRDLMMGSRNALVDDLMVKDVFAVRTQDDALDAARRIRSRHLKLLPVVNDRDQLCGVITIDQAMDILAHEMADDLVALNAASPDESFFTPPREAVKKRLPWMAGNIFLNLGAVWVISSFEDTLVQVAILAAFLPMITDMGGNVGIQALSVSIRSMALGESRVGDVWKAVRKETIIGLCNGLALGVLFSVIAFALQGNAILGLVAGIALGINVLVAGVVGGSMPFLIKRLGKDPAMMTGPVLTTITDITGVTIYLGLSTLFLASLMTGGAV